MSEITIKSEDIQVFFHDQTGMPFGYQYGNDLYEGGAELPYVIVKKLCDMSVTEGDMVLLEMQSGIDSVRVQYQYRADGEAAGTFSFYYHFEKNSILFSLEDVREEAGYHLLEVKLPCFLSSRIANGGKVLHNNRRGGYLADVISLPEGDLLGDDGSFDGYPNASILPVMALLYETSFCMMEVQGYVCHMILERKKERLHMGVAVPYRIAGGEHTPDLLAGQSRVCRIDFGGDMDGNGRVDWLDAAKLKRQQMPEIPSHYFDDKLFFIIANAMGRKEAELTFRETEELLYRVAMITDGAPSVACLTGWSQGGHDTSYPNIYQMNPQLGTLEEYLALKKRAREDLNCNLTLNDNFDDQCLNEYTKDTWFHDRYIARTRENVSVTANVWNGVDQSYITGFASYMEDGGDGVKRIRHELDTYQVRDAILIDAMSWWSIRHNFHPEHPASAVKNLTDGKFKAIDIFRQNGVAVISELLRYPFIGKLSMVCDGSFGFDEPDEHDIPFLRVALQNSIRYGSRGGSYSYPEETLYHNAVVHPWLHKGDTDEKIADIYYLNYLIWFALLKEDLLDYQCENGRYKLVLENGKIVIDTENRKWSAWLKGRQILDNTDVSCPVDEKRVAFYSKEGHRICYDLEDRAERFVTAEELTGEGKQAVSVEWDGSRVIVNCRPNVPVIVRCS